MVDRKLKALANWWELHRRDTHRNHAIEEEILRLNERDFSAFLRQLEHPDSIRSLCEYLKSLAQNGLP